MYARTMYMWKLECNCSCNYINAFFLLFLFCFTFIFSVCFAIHMNSIVCFMICWCVPVAIQKKRKLGRAKFHETFPFCFVFYLCFLVVSSYVIVAFDGRVRTPQCRVQTYRLHKIRLFLCVFVSCICWFSFQHVWIYIYIYWIYIIHFEIYN